MLKLVTFVQVAADWLRRREEGQTMAEYGVVLAVITRRQPAGLGAAHFKWSQLTRALFEPSS